MDPDVPGGEIGGEKESGEGDQQRQFAAGPMDRLPRDLGNRRKERQRQRQPPKARRDGPDLRQPDQPRPEGERATADKDRGEGEAVVGRLAHAPRLGGSAGLRKPEPDAGR
jgi:hypothetical protein